MSLATVNRVPRRRRRRLAAFAVVAALAAAVSAHHLPSADHDHMASADVVALCLAVLPLAAAALMAAGNCWAPPGFTLTLPWAPFCAPTTSPAPRARSSPVATVVLRC